MTETVTTNIDTNDRDTIAENLMSKALAEAQQSMRFYDTKAQICGIGYVFSLNIVLGINNTLWPDPQPTLLAVLMGWFVFLLPMFFFAYVLYPTRPPLSAEDRGTNSNAKKILYIRRDRYQTADQVKNAARNANVLDELAFELVKASHLRDRKRTRFMRALLLALGSFLIMLSLHLIEIFLR